MAAPLILRWPNREPAHEALITQLQPDRVIGAETVPGSITRGLWPGIRSPAKQGSADIASASREPWVDANGYLAAYQRAIGQPALLAHSQNDPERGVPFDTLELALIEARVNGGNFILSVEPRYRGALLAADPTALEAWRSLARTASWLRQNEQLFNRPTLPIVTALVEPGFLTSEIANLLYRRGASPALTSEVPPPDPAKINLLIAAGLKSVPETAYRHASAGATAVTDSAPPKGWTTIKEDTDRTIYSVGKGRVVAYHTRIKDPSEFALDCIDLLTHRRRAARLWNAPAAIPLATAGGLLHIIQYGGPVENEIQARVQGIYKSAALLRPDAPPLALKVYHRGTATEVFPPAIRRLAVVQFQ
ncbi:MAG: hypothetical protein HYX27_02805 [Acidobacteria bacterium]|nr:hypothetical protein [Acidobacteriota bacterium]